MAHYGVPTASGTPCQRRTDGGPCFMHDESGPPSDHGGRPGNTNAVGNSGGGAPPLNTNAMIHGGFSDPDKYYQRLDGEAKTWVDGLTDCIVARSKAEFTAEQTKRLARRAATLHHQWYSTAMDTRERGLVVERKKSHEPTGTTSTVERVNPALPVGRSLSRQEHRIYRTLGVYPTPNDCPWTEWE
jgi:hypothetical protein